MEHAETARRYRMCVTDGVGDRLAEALGCTVESDRDAVVLVGEYVDQAHLTGVINRLHGLRIQIRSVEVVEEAS